MYPYLLFGDMGLAHVFWSGPRTGQAHRLARPTDWPGPRTGQAHGLARPTDCGQAHGLASQAHGLARPTNWLGLQTVARPTNWLGSWTVARPMDCGQTHRVWPCPQTKARTSQAQRLDNSRTTAILKQKVNIAVM